MAFLLRRLFGEFYLLGFSPILVALIATGSSSMAQNIPFSGFQLFQADPCFNKYDVNVGIEGMEYHNPNLSGFRLFVLGTLVEGLRDPISCTPPGIELGQNAAITATTQVVLMYSKPFKVTVTTSDSNVGCLGGGILIPNQPTTIDTSSPSFEGYNYIYCKAGGDSLFTITLSNLQTSQSTIAVSKANFEQVVEDPRIGGATSGPIDAVQGKSASFKVTLSGPTNTSSLPGSVVVNVLNGSTLLASSPAVPLSSFKTDGTLVITPDQFTGAGGKAYVPATAGTVSPIFRVVPSSDATGITAGADYTQMSLNVHQINPPKIGFAEIDSLVPCSGANLGLSCYLSPVAANVALTLQSDRFVSATYPVQDHAYSWANLSVSKNIGSQGAAGISLSQDVINLELKRRSLGLNRMVGIVGPGYLDAHGIKAVGYAPLAPPGQHTYKSVFATAGYPEVVAHELAHSFGQLSEAYCGDPNGCLDSNLAYGAYDAKSFPVRGFDATAGISYWFPLPDPSAPQNAIRSEGFMNGGIGIGELFASPPRVNFTEWVDTKTYDIVFGALNSLPPNDPPTIAISGVLTSSGQFSFGPTENLANGTVTDTDPNGTLSVALLDQSGNILSQTAMTPTFQGLATYEVGSLNGPTTVNTTAMPVIVELPFNANAFEIQVLHSGISIQKTTLSGQLLEGILRRIPSNAFREPRECNRSHLRGRALTAFCQDYASFDAQKLLREAREIQIVLNSRDSRRAIDLLTKLVRRFKNMTISNYSTADDSELNQIQVIAQLQDIIKSLKNQKSDGKQCKK